MKEDANNKTTTERNKEKTGWTLATWNIRGLNGKEMEIIEEYEKNNISILAITETKRKGQHETYLGNGHMMILSGVPNKERAAGGVGCIINRDLTGYVKAWECISERILKIEIEPDKENKQNILILYGPNEDATTTTKEEFWENVTEVIEDTKGSIVVLGDLNGRVGKKEAKTSDTIGIHGEVIRNNNGNRIIDFCIQNNLVVMNTFFQHKDIHKYTRECKSRNERSIIDYIIVSRDVRRKIKDVKVNREAEIFSDHYLLTAKTNFGIRTKREDKANNNKARKTIKNTSKLVVKSYKLSDEEIARRYNDKIERIIKINKDVQKYNLEEAWQFLKTTILNAGKEICGITKIIKYRNQTNWWNEEIREEIKRKKQRWKKYIREGTEENYKKYKEQRIKVKQLVTEAKEKSWEEFGEKMEQDYHTNQKLFYKTIKNLRTGNRPQAPRQIQDEKGKILTDEDAIMTRWEEYFKTLLNPQNTESRNEVMRTTETEDEQEEPDEWEKKARSS